MCDGVKAQGLRGGRNMSGASGAQEKSFIHHPPKAHTTPIQVREVRMERTSLSGLRQKLGSVERAPNALEMLVSQAHGEELHGVPWTVDEVCV